MTLGEFFNYLSDTKLSVKEWFLNLDMFPGGIIVLFVGAVLVSFLLFCLFDD